MKYRILFIKDAPPPMQMFTGNVIVSHITAQIKMFPAVSQSLTFFEIKETQVYSSWFSSFRNLPLPFPTQRNEKEKEDVAILNKYSS